ncbi:hypothetical protein Rsub_03320 [Raphidocelis subcapitata]|uniref:Uncharacterized protein n=1 Tax=Raphidocelis subcapitata TaxID=307507 RepID=A0A2V0NZ36_9CHLO|nr:hypothetical protein Rsub_03320 [Raphidocelis subcapitata]|eukprot:GBF90187.1 hypothetical protein Rsub_03320 [Raphidocelis subcapitata]
MAKPKNVGPAAVAAAADAGAGADADGGAAAAGALPPLPDAPPLGAPLLEPSDRRGAELLAQILPKGPREALLQLRKSLKDALRAERAQPAARAKLAAGVTAEELGALSAGLARAPDDAGLRQLPVITLGTAAAQILGGPRWGAWCALGALERQVVALIQEAADGAPDAGASLAALLSDAAAAAAAGRGGLRVGDAFQLVAFCYSLSGDLTPPAPPFYSEDERAVAGALASALAACLEGREGAAALDADAWAALPAPIQETLSEAHHSGVTGAPLRATLDARLSEALARLRWAAAARGKLRDVRRLVAPSGPDGAPEAAPLVRQVLGKILLRADIRDLQHASGPSLGGLLKAGLGRLGLGAAAALGALAGAATGAGGGGGGGGSAAGAAAAARPGGAPHDYPAVIIFVVGGICAAEARAVRRELEAHTFGPRPAVVLGGTALLAPEDAARQLLA